MLRMSRAVPPFPHMLSWCAQGQYYLYINVSETVKSEVYKIIIFFYQYAHAQSVKRLTADGFSIRFLATLVGFFFYVTVVGSIASKKYTLLFPPRRGLIESLDSESDWCDPLDDPVE